MFEPTDHFTLPDVLRRQLAPGERVLWHGRPPQGLLLRRADAWLIPLSCAWGGGVIFNVLHLLKTSAQMEDRAEMGFLVVWGLPFVLVGLYLMLGRFWVDAYLRARTCYVLTHERLLLVGGWSGQQIKSLPLRNLPQITLKVNASGGGVIQLGSESRSLWSACPPGWLGAPLQPDALELADDAQRVFHLIQSAQRQSG